jgi:putative membrane-bound dehydrogenase-like protein
MSATGSRPGYTIMLLCALLVAMPGCQNQKTRATSNLSPEESLPTLEVAPGFQVELIASEPLIVDPVAMEIDPHGNMFVVEMRGNPFDETGIARVKLLSDTNGDGTMDRSSIFADSLVMPSGVTSWKKGILVTDPPNVVYYEDSDGDGVADTKEILLTGFDASDLESNVNTPIYGLDNWIYLGNGPGSRKGDICFADGAGPCLPDNASGHIVRFRPDTKELEVLSSQTQYGHNFDQWGHHFLVNNSNHIYQEVIGAGYLSRNQELLLSDATQSLADHGEAGEVYPITVNPEHQLLTDVGVFTSACSVTPYTGALLPSVFDSVSFVAEPVSNLVHADVLKNTGATFTASRLYKEKEFLASTDAWFRPVSIYIGPDGALYVVDYYRQIIEGPEWMAEEVVKSGDLYNGSDKGRIYRISPKGTKKASWSKESTFADLTSELLVQKLADPNLWWRRHAQRLLVERKDAATVPSLLSMTENQESALGRLHALWTLQGMGRLTPETIAKALHDTEQGVRENAVRLAELHLATTPGLSRELLSLKDDASAKVRYQLLCTLGAVDGPEAAKVREEILVRDVRDPWVQAAALSARSLKKDVMLDKILSHFVPEDSALVRRLGAMIAANDKSERVYEVMKRATASNGQKAPAWQMHVLEGIGDGLKNRKSAITDLHAVQQLAIKNCLESQDPGIRRAALHIVLQVGLPKGPETAIALAKAERIASDPKKGEQERAGAIKFMALSNPEPYVSLLKKSILPGQPLPVQLAALQTMSVIPDVTVSEYVLEQWPVLTPEIREAALNTFVVEPFNVPRLKLLLDALEKGHIEETSLGWPRTVTLMRDIPEPLKARARSLLAKQETAPEVVFTQYESALELKADEVHGKDIFRKNCSQCHQVGSANGIAFGPDLSTVRNWTPRNLLVNILDPSVSIANGYDLWTFALKNGETKQGIISSETASAITLRYPGGQEEVIPRSDVNTLKALNVSAMPRGLEKQMTQQDMADLMAFLKNFRSE